MKCEKCEVLQEELDAARRMLAATSPLRVPLVNRIENEIQWARRRADSEWHLAAQASERSSAYTDLATRLGTLKQLLACVQADHEAERGRLINANKGRRRKKA